VDKINIVSSQVVLEMSFFSVDTRSASIVEDRTRNRWAAVSIQPHYGFVCGRHDSAWPHRSCNPQDWDLGCLEATDWAQENLAFLDAAVLLLHVCDVVCRCTVLLEHKVVTRHSAYRWQQYDVIMTSWNSIEEVSKLYHQNFLLCNNNEIKACIADLFHSFCEEVYAVAFSR